MQAYTELEEQDKTTYSVTFLNDEVTSLPHTKKPEMEKGVEKH